MRFKDQENCPKCGSNWNDGDIFQKLRELHPEESDEEILESAEMFGWSKENPKHFSRCIGIEDPFVYDGISWWRCPDCETTWNRWTEIENPINLSG
jgi:uncharacterized Zn ribbon protein